MTETPGGKEHTPKLGVKRINEISISYQQAGVLWVGIELELFTKISQGMNQLDQIAETSITREELLWTSILPRKRNYFGKKSVIF